MQEIQLTIETNGGVAFSISMDEIAQTQLSHPEILSISEAVKHLKIKERGKHIALWSRTEKELRLL